METRLTEKRPQILKSQLRGHLERIHKKSHATFGLSEKENLKIPIMIVKITLR